jgi:N-dimethylarginine dimethylaminohydrolase
LPAEVEVVLVCPDAAARDVLLAAVHQPAERFRIVLTGAAMTSWSRDRWVALRNPERTVLLTPAIENGADTWPARRGDEQIATRLAETLDGFATTRSRLQFDGGDFLADGRRVFVAPAVLKRNPSVSRDAMAAELGALFGKEVVFLHNAPPHHIGMYLAIAGESVAVVGDPSLTTGRVPSGLLEGDYAPGIQQQFHDVATQLKALGYRVERIPTVVAPDTKTYLTYVNGLIEARDGVRTVYMPSYRGVEAINQQATDVWKKLGFRVVPVDCTAVFPYFGTLHCLVNVLARS